MGLPYHPGFHPELANLCECLRYLLGGERPTQTTRQILYPEKSRLELSTNKGGISLVSRLLGTSTYSEHDRK